MIRLAAWGVAVGLAACTSGGKGDAGEQASKAIPPAPNASAHDLMPEPEAVPPVSDGMGFTLVYTHSMDGEIEPCG
jgi:hypothetical protein